MLLQCGSSLFGIWCILQIDMLRLWLGSVWFNTNMCKWCPNGTLGRVLSRLWSCNSCTRNRATNGNRGNKNDWSFTKCQYGVSYWEAMWDWRSSASAVCTYLPCNVSQSFRLLRFNYVWRPWDVCMSRWSGDRWSEQSMCSSWRVPICNRYTLY